MEDSTYEAIYTAVYVFVFVIALSITIFMFKTIYDYSERSYEYGNKGLDESVIVNAPASKFRLINGDEVISYFYNYIKRDMFGNAKTDIDYRVNIRKLNGEVIFSSVSTPIDTINNATFYKVASSINTNTKYVLTYTSQSANLIYIDINEATDEQINSLL